MSYLVEKIDQGNFIFIIQFCNFAMQFKRCMLSNSKNQKPKLFPYVLFKIINFVSSGEILLHSTKTSKNKKAPTALCVLSAMKQLFKIEF